MSKPSTVLDAAKFRLKWAEEELTWARQKLVDAQTWLKSIEELHAKRQRELAEALKKEQANG